MIKIAICDDEPIIADVILSKISEFRPEYKADVYYSGESLLNSDIKYDLIFLDIEMSGINGMETALQIRKYNKDVYIVFLTSHTEFMQDAFKVRAYRFLVKPIDENDFFESVIQAENEMMNTEKISITVNDKTSLVSLDDIIYIEAFGDGAFIYTNNEVYESNKTLKYWTEQLGKIHFFRVHKSYLVSFKYINSVDATSVLMCGISQAIPISRRNYSNFKRAFVEYVKKYAKYV